MKVKWELLNASEATEILNRQTEENTVHSGISLHAWDDIFKLECVLYKAEGILTSDHIDVYREKK